MKSKEELEKSPAYWKEKAENWKWRYDQLKLESTKPSPLSEGEKAKDFLKSKIRSASNDTAIFNTRDYVLYEDALRALELHQEPSQKKLCKGCEKDVTKTMYCECGEQPLDNSMVINQEPSNNISEEINREGYVKRSPQGWVDILKECIEEEDPIRLSRYHTIEIIDLLSTLPTQEVSKESK